MPPPKTSKSAKDAGGNERILFVCVHLAFVLLTLFLPLCQNPLKTFSSCQRNLLFELCYLRFTPEKGKQPKCHKSNMQRMTDRLTTVEKRKRNMKIKHGKHKIHSHNYLRQRMHSEMKGSINKICRKQSRADVKRKRLK